MIMLNKAINNKKFFFIISAYLLFSELLSFLSIDLASEATII